MAAPVNILHLIDSLDVGGAERVAVNLVNTLPRERYRCHLCTTRRDGALSAEVASDVGRLQLNRKRRFDGQALRKLSAYIRDHHIAVLHAHSTSILTAFLAALSSPSPALLWHDHYGLVDVKTRFTIPYRMVKSRVSGVIAVNEKLANWSREGLGMDRERVHVVYNFVVSEPAQDVTAAQLTGAAGKRIVCVANFKPQKDHLTLLKAMAHVVAAESDARLFLVGCCNDDSYFEQVRHAVDDLFLADHVEILGARGDVPSVLKAADIAVLSSVSEGLPLALLEYGAAGLPVVATKVGQCPEVLDYGAAGVIVEPGCPEKLADGILALLQSPQRRASLSSALRLRVDTVYSGRAALEKIDAIYRDVLAGG